MFKMPEKEKVVLAMTEKPERNKSDKKKKLEEELDELYKKASYGIDDVIKDEYDLKYLEKNNKTDDQLESIAKEKTDRIKQEKIDGIKESNMQAVSNKKQMVKDEEVRAEVDKQHIDDVYEDAKDNASNQSIKRGIARSSIILNLLKDYDQNKIYAKEKRDKEKREKLSAIEEEINTLNSKMKDAITKLDMQSAYELNEEITRLKKERDEENQRIQKYNNDVTDKIAKYKNEFINSERGKEILQKTDEQHGEYNRQMTKLVLDYFDSLPYNEVVEDFKNTDYSKYLSKNSMKLLETYVKNRAFQN